MTANFTPHSMNSIKYTMKFISYVILTRIYEDI